MLKLVVPTLALAFVSAEGLAKPVCFAGEPWRAWADADPQRLYINGDEESLLLQYTGPIAEDEQGRAIPAEAVSFHKRIEVPPGRYRLRGDIKAGNSNDGWQLLVENGAADRPPLIRRNIAPHASRRLNDRVVVAAGIVPSVKLRAVTHNKSWVIVSQVRLCKG